MCVREHVRVCTCVCVCVCVHALVRTCVNEVECLCVYVRMRVSLVVCVPVCKCFCIYLVVAHEFVYTLVCSSCFFVYTCCCCLNIYIGNSLGTPHWTLRSNIPPTIFTATTTILQGLRRGNPATLEKVQIVFTAVCKTPASKHLH